MSSPVTRRAPDRLAALAQYRRRANVYDTELAAFEPIRTKAIAGLCLRPGATVLDVGCGTGLSFHRLLHLIGQAGRIVGVEQCPEMLDKAHARVREGRWNNVDLICAPAAAARVRVRADAALFHFTHDIVRDSDAIDNVLGHLKPGARVVTSGLRWAPVWAWPTNVFVMLAAMHSVTSFDGLSQPWDKLCARLHEVAVHAPLLGGVYVASGVYQPRPG